MNKVLIIIIFFFSISCKSGKHQASNYYTDSERDSLLTNIITYIYSPAPDATNSTKWQPKFRSYYKNSLPSFHLQNYTIGENSWNYYFVIRPVGGSIKRRGVIGKFKLEKGSLMPTDFEETINTPHLDEEIVRERGAFLFEELVRNGNLNKYLKMEQYIQWPDSSLVYDKKTNNWVVPISKISAK